MVVFESIQPDPPTPSPDGDGEVDPDIDEAPDVDEGIDDTDPGCVFIVNGVCSDPFAPTDDDDDGETPLDCALPENAEACQVDQ